MNKNIFFAMILSLASASSFAQSISNTTSNISVVQVAPQNANQTVSNVSNNTINSIPGNSSNSVKNKEVLAHNYIDDMKKLEEDAVKKRYTLIFIGVFLVLAILFSSIIYFYVSKKHKDEEGTMKDE